MGAYRRRIELRTTSPSAVEGELEDDFHHFTVAIEHDGARVVALDGVARRHPWSTCPDALGPLRALVGAPLSPSSIGHGDHADPRSTCTHWFDLAGLAMAQAATGRGERRYDATVGERDADLRAGAALSRDGEPVLAWTVSTQEVLDPAPYAGQRLGRGFLAWAESALDPDGAEAAIVLRRACSISLGRLMDLDEYERAGDIEADMLGSCYTFSAGVAEHALRVKGSTRPD